MTNYHTKLMVVARQLYHEYYCETCRRFGCKACGDCNIEIVLHDPVVKLAARELIARDREDVKRRFKRK